jgi:hypothetical protein
MLITKEQQEAWVSNYVNEKHTQDECIGFIDGVEKALGVVNKNFDLALVSERSKLLFAFIAEVKKEFADENWDYLDFIAERALKADNSH